MPNMKQDLRVLKTKSAIEEAFLDLLSEQEYIKIRIIDIANKANVNRNTIYLYYQSKEGIVRSIVQKSFQSKLTKSDLESFFNLKNRKDVENFFYKLFEVLNENIKVFHLLISDTNLTGYMLYALKQFRSIMFKNLKDTPENEIIFDYTINGIFGAIQKWFVYSSSPVEKNVKILTDLTISCYRRMEFIK